jgi:hypothetical protein
MTLTLKTLTFAGLVAAATVGAATAHAQQDGLVAHPDVYRVQFENDWVRLVRVTIPGSTTLPAHTHPAGYMIHLYFNDAGPVVFEHDGSPYTITRPPVKARSYRVGPATPETHIVVNSSPGATDFMRIEFKAAPAMAPRRRLAAPPLVDETSSTEEISSDLFKATRVTVASTQSLGIPAGADHPALLIALTEVAAAGGGSALAIGQERFISPGGKETIRNDGVRPVQFLKVDILLKLAGR